MKAIVLTILFSLITLSGWSQGSSFYHLSAKTIDGETYSFEQLKGKKVIIVNTATRCSLSPQFNGLQKLHEEYAQKGVVILAFPCNDFANREPGNEEDIKKTCEKRFGITFQLMEKVAVNGNNIHPVYQWLTQKDLNQVKDSGVKWNFQKYLISENGQLVDLVEPMKKPSNEIILSFLQTK